MNPGQQATRTMTIDADLVRKFAEITGDYNPLHFEEAFAAKTRFGRLIAQGGLATGLLHALVAMELPGAEARLHRRHYHRRWHGQVRAGQAKDGRNGVPRNEPERRCGA